MLRLADMAEKYYSMAGVSIAVEIPEARMYAEDRNLAPFRTGAVKETHRFSFEMVEELPEPQGECLCIDSVLRVYRDGQWQIRYVGAVAENWQNAYMRIAHRGKEHRVQLKQEHYPAGVNVTTVLSAVAAEHLVAQAGGFVFHTAYIEVEGGAILFTAPSGTGKSTQAELWHSLRGAEIINGDRAAVRVTGEGIFACGIPFAGSSQICKNKTLPLKAVVYLTQAPQSTIRKLRGLEAFRSIWEGVSVNTWDADDMNQVSQAVQRIAQEIPVYHLACTPDESAVLALEQALRKQAEL